MTEYVPSGFPGCRAPQAWLEIEGKQRTTLDLLGPWLTALIAGEDDLPSVDGIPIHVLHTRSAELLHLYGIRPGDCALVRPDGHVAWRGPTECARTGSRRQLIPERLGKIRVPTLFLVGGASPPEMRLGVQALAAAVPNAELPGQAHTAHIAAPDLLAREILNFLRQS